jgi:adenine-specific DNA methylase
MNINSVTPTPFINLYAADLPSSRTGIFYNTFSYPTKISPESIAVYIAAHTKPGDTVLDVFGGSGSTGLAALMCEHPTEAMISLASKLNLNPVWGMRNSIVYEIGKFGAFASSVMANPPKRKVFTRDVKQLLKNVESVLNGIYNIADESGMQGVIRHIIYSDVVKCPECNGEFSYYAGMVQHNPLSIDGNGKCPYCGHADKNASFQHMTETVNDGLLGVQTTRRKRIPVRIYGQTGAIKWVRDASDADIESIKTAESAKYPPHCEAKEIRWGDLYRAGYHTGITHLHHFYTKRNYTVMSCLWEKSSEYAPEMRDAIRLLLLSYNASHATLMTRVVVKKNSKDFVLTGAQSGVLYISSLPVEKNIFTGIKRKLRYFEEAFEYLEKCSGHISVLNASSQRLALPDRSIDYIFTDPPFGDFIPYSEVNQINEMWIGEPTNRSGEIIVSKSQSKTVSTYQVMMTKVFAEMRRVLKDDSNATVVFHSSKAAVWNALRSAYTDAGFVVEATGSLEKNQVTFKQVVSENSVQGDPLILLSKGNGTNSTNSSRSVLDEVIADGANSSNRNERKMYANYIGECLKRGIAVDLDAKAAYNYIAERVRILT